jgi:hypothetical protein
MMSHDKYNFGFVSANGSYFNYSVQDPTVISGFVLDVSSQMQQIMWLPSSAGDDGEWMVIWTGPTTPRRRLGSGCVRGEVVVGGREGHYPGLQVRLAGAGQQREQRHL